jgi:hypothetical protein
MLTTRSPSKPVEANPRTGADMIRIALAAAALLALPAAGHAQAGRAPVERARDRAELRQDRHELARDRHDLRWMQDLLARFDAARARRDRRALAAVEQDVLRTLAYEEREARLELRDARGELARERAEAAHERRDDTHDRRDDRRDLRDDRRDVRRVAAIRDDFAHLEGRMNRRELDRKRGMLLELIRMARAELREDRREVREDRRELHEDLHR